MKYKVYKSVLFGLMLVLLVSGCNRKEGDSIKPEKLEAPIQSADQQTRIFLNDSMPLHRIEAASEALVIWRQFSEQKPTMLLLSIDPMLAPVPETLSAETASFITSRTHLEISERSSLWRSNPFMLPAMTVDAALRNGWFGRLIWVLPMRNAGLDLSAKRFRQQLKESGMATEAELETVSVVGNRLNGVLRETPFVAAALPNLSEINGPVIIHFDQSYFEKLYKNEISTPIIPLVYESLKALRDRKIPVLAVTFAYGNLDGNISLDVRFVGDVLQAFIEHPELFDQPMPKSWKLQGDILYINNFFQKEKTLELALEMEKTAPESAWVKFTLYRAAAENNMGTAALGSLAEAVAIDKVYALEYLALSDMAYEKKRPDEALRMLKLAHDAFPDNFQITLNLAQLLAELGQVETALQLIEPLQKLSWSKVYYADMPDALARFAKQLKNGDDQD